MPMCYAHAEDLVSHRNGVAHCPVRGCGYAIEVTCLKCRKPVPMQRLMMGWVTCSVACASSVIHDRSEAGTEPKRLKEWHRRCARLDRRFRIAWREANSG